MTVFQDTDHFGSLWWQSFKTAITCGDPFWPFWSPGGPKRVARDHRDTRQVVLAGTCPKKVQRHNWLTCGRPFWPLRQRRRLQLSSVKCQGGLCGTTMAPVPSLAPVPPIVPVPPWRVFGQLPFVDAFALGPWAGVSVAQWSVRRVLQAFVLMAPGSTLPRRAFPLPFLLFHCAVGAQLEHKPHLSTGRCKWEVVLAGTCGAPFWPFRAPGGLKRVARAHRLINFRIT